MNNTSGSKRGSQKKPHNVDHKSLEHIMWLFLLLISFDRKTASLLSCLNYTGRHCSNSLKIIFTYFFPSMLSFHILLHKTLKFLLTPLPLRYCLFWDFNIPCTIWKCFSFLHLSRIYGLRVIISNLQSLPITKSSFFVETITRNRNPGHGDI